MKCKTTLGMQNPAKNDIIASHIRHQFRNVLTLPKDHPKMMIDISWWTQNVYFFSPT